MTSGAPAPRDPRLERRSGVPGSERRLWWTQLGLACAIVVLSILAPRAWQGGQLFEENRRLVERLKGIEGELREARRIVDQLQVIDAAVRDAMPEGDAGGHTQSTLDGLIPLAPIVPFDRGPEVDFLATTNDLHSRLTALKTWWSAAGPRIEPWMAVRQHDLGLAAALPRRWPTDGLLTSPFGWRRSPFSGRWEYHSGIDIDGELGDRVDAAAPGIVAFAGIHEGYGRMVQLVHGFEIETLYGHLSTIDVNVGDAVEKGQRIGAVGSTGRSTGTHLHFEVHVDGHHVDPLGHLSDDP